MSSFDIPLEWAVVVKASGGWKILARFVTEGEAWHYGTRMLDARVWHEDKCIGHKDGYRMPWKACDKTGPCYQRIIDEVREAEQRQREDSDYD